jgi:hypothetical protein
MSNKNSWKEKSDHTYENLWKKFNKFLEKYKILSFAIFVSGIAIIVILILSMIHVNTEITIDVRADSVSFEQLKDFSWFGDSINSSFLVFEGVKFKFGTSYLYIRKNGNLLFESTDDIEDLEIYSSTKNKLDFSARVYQSVSEKSGFPLKNIELDSVDISKGARVYLDIQKKPTKITLGIVKGKFKGEINTEKFYLTLRNGEIKSKNNKKIKFSGNLQIKGNILQILPFNFMAESEGKITLIKPSAVNASEFLNEGNIPNAINKLNITISRDINNKSKRKKSYLKYSVIGNNFKHIKNLTAGKQIFISSEKNFDINLFRVSSRGIDFISETKSTKIFEDNKNVTSTLLQYFPFNWFSQD